MKMNSKMRTIKIALFSLLISRACFGVDVDKIAHVGGSFALNTALYGLYSKTLKVPKAQATALSISTTLLLGLAKEIADASRNHSQIDGSDVLANTVGAASSGLLNLTFDF
jgi:VanZ family protein